MQKQKRSENESFWHIRSARYDKLYWVKHDGYVHAILKHADLKTAHTALDVGTGTGVIAQAIRPLVKHAVAVDVSDSMLQKGAWAGISTINLDIGDSFFADAVFDRVVARMVFHHILENPDRALTRCHDLLKSRGKIIIAEGVPPSEDVDVIDWYTRMFALKEDRVTLTASGLVAALKRNSFTNIKCHIYMMDNFSIRNWLDNSGLPNAQHAAIMAMHRNASPKIKRLYRMRFEGDDCLIRTRNVIVVGVKP
jgi:ubiquinone/menaquinone biosynthesis C-methylase UbiE